MFSGLLSMVLRFEEGEMPIVKGQMTTPEMVRKRPSLARFLLEPSVPPFALEAALAVIQVGGTYLASRGQPERESLNALAVVLLLAGPAVLTVRKSHPVAVAWGVSGVTLAYMLLGYPYGPVVLSVIVALFAAVTSGHRVAAWLSATALYVLHFGARFLFDIDSKPTLEQLSLVAAWLIVVLVASEVIRARHDWVEETARTREQDARRRASEERLRIARELHDVLAHHISLMNVQAGVALHLMDRQPEQARTALTAIEAASREALGELRSVLAILQQPQTEAPLRLRPVSAGWRDSPRARGRLD
jgi:signal transduction histidine kinase